MSCFQMIVYFTRKNGWDDCVLIGSTLDIQTFSEKVFGPPKADSKEVFECRGIVILICGSTSTKYILMYHMALEMVI